MPNIDWKFLIIGLILGAWGIPFILGLLNSRRKTSTASATN